MPKKSHEVFYKEVNNINPNLILLDKYISSKDKIKVKNVNCGHEWHIQPDNFLRKKSGCICTVCNPIRKLHKTFEQEVYNINPDLILLSQYINALTKVKVGSKGCEHTWYINPSDFLKKVGNKCKVCNPPNSKTHSTFEQEVYSINPDLVLLDQYINNSTRIKVKGKCTHEWFIIPKHFLNIGIGNRCPICNPIRKPHKTFEQEVFNINPDLILLDTYINNICKLKVGSKSCKHEWYINPHDFLSRRSGTECPICKPKGTSKGERQLADWLSNYVRIESNSRILDGKEIDIYIPEYNLGIEYNGEYWHSKKDKDYHLTKTLKAKELGITLIHVFEHEWLQKQEIVKSRLLSMLSNSYKLGARNCTIKEISFPKEFLNENHIQGAGNSSKYNIALFYKELLVAVMTFSKPRFNKNYEYELIRYCSLTGINVVGGASKLLKYFIKTYNPNSIISYSDKRWSTGNLYKQLGFKYLQTSSPNYFYYKGTEVITRYKAQKHRLDKLVPDHYDESLTETEIMNNAGYLKVYDCGNDVWVMSTN